MISMKEYEYIRLAYFRYGKNKSEISREMQRDRRTIDKAIKGIEPGYQIKKERNKPVIGKYMPIIRNWLEKDKEVPRKQRHTAKRIYDRLVKEHGYKGGNSTVRRAVRKLKQELNLLNMEGFIASDPEKLEGAEMDWGELQIELNGERTKVYLFCLRSKYSGKVFAKLYPSMQQECFFNGHIEAFAYFGGVFSEIVYDNLSTAVKKVLKGRSRIEQSAFTSFRTYYNYKASFCNICKGNEKGGVERMIGFVRRNFLTPIPKCKNFEEVNNVLLNQCQNYDSHKIIGRKGTISFLFDEEKKKLIGVPKTPYNNYKLIETKVDKYLTVCLQNNRYSVPPEYKNKKVTVELGLYDVRITLKNKLIAKHERSFRKDKWILDPWHYMEILEYKSRAFKSSRVLTTIENEWDPVVKKMWHLQIEKRGEIEGTKETIKILLYFKTKSYSEMVATLELAIETNAISQERIKLLFETLDEPVLRIEDANIDKIKAISNFSIPSVDVEKFDQLSGEIL